SPPRRRSPPPMPRSPRSSRKRPPRARPRPDLAERRKRGCGCAPSSGCGRMCSMAQTWLVIGLGNPGPQYELTRHNVGQLVVDELAERRRERFSSHKANARVAETWLRPGAAKIVLAKPNSYMNVSGGPVSALAKYYGVDAAHIVVVHDELDIPFDTVKLKVGGGHGGHNGVRDVAKALGTADFPRVRI